MLTRCKVLHVHAVTACCSKFYEVHLMWYFIVIRSLVKRNCTQEGNLRYPVASAIPALKILAPPLSFIV